MYTDKDLDYAIKQGIFSAESVEQFRTLLSEQKHAPSVDEENFRLISGFNDIFVVIACMLLLFSSLWVLNSFTGSDTLGLITFTMLSWALAEFFVLNRKMAFPGIVLLLSFIGGVFSLVISLLSHSDMSYISATAVSAIAAYLHWTRFRVPITVAVGTAAALGLVASMLAGVFPNAEDWLLLIVFLCGLLTFFIAMYWDAADRLRATRNADVAFWLHLLSAPLIIHPVFSNLGVLDGNESTGNMVVVIFLYIFMTLISIVIDRRAFMVSALVYVLYAITSLLQTYGGVGYSFALTGVFMGGMLLLLSAFWHRARASMVTGLPDSVRQYIPDIQDK
ncbi:hypothetical protein [Oceanospirillum sediminis]|uniref:DUF2157 domain-containing protein n=1 Tax=Oceanospirillum sediminis TaxID=2760088 RepID=A0A839IQY4_9GAMM|nr:hypothetical protein [Oceanospirillum sediminis]MBB1487331.1 hypothetical protein [Oceanospirillum sediminis]